MNLMKKGFAGVLAAFAVSALSPVLIPFALDGDGNLNGAGYAAGVMFWLGMIAGIIGYILLYSQYKKKRTEKTKRKLPSPLRFFSNRPAQVMDAVLIIGLIGTIYCIVNVTADQIVAAAFLLLALAGIYAHFLLNGNVYQYIRNYKPKNKKVQLEKERIER